jgi:ABC-2 type transport system ATP-binding protein
MHGELLEVIAEPLREANDIIAGLPGVLGVQVFGERLHLWVEDAATGEEAVRAALTGRQITVTGIRRAAPGLEDVFISVISGGERNGDLR